MGVPRFSGSSTFEGVLIDWSLDQPVDLPGLPVGLLSREQAVEELQRRQRRQAMDAAYEAQLILRLADQSPDDADPPAGTPGARRPGWAAERDVAGVSEFFASELALVLNRGRGTANHLHHRAVVWRDSLPATFRALSAGELDLARAAALADVLGYTTAELAQRVEALLLPEAADLSVAKLRIRALELLAELDAAAADSGGRRRSGTRTCSCSPAPMAWPPSAPNCRPTRRPRPTPNSTSWRSWPRPTATSVRSGRSAPSCSRCCCGVPAATASRAWPRT